MGKKQGDLRTGNLFKAATIKPWAQKQPTLQNVLISPRRVMKYDAKVWTTQESPQEVYIDSEISPQRNHGELALLSKNKKVI